MRLEAELLVGQRVSFKSSSNVHGVQALPSGNALTLRNSLQDCVHMPSFGLTQEMQIVLSTQSRQVWPAVAHSNPELRADERLEVTEVVLLRDDTDDTPLNMEDDALLALDALLA